MVIIKLQGGLGNQLFQYALGRNLSLKNNVELKFDISALEENKIRKYSLETFHIQGLIASDVEIRKFKNGFGRVKDFFLPYYYKSVIIERQFNFDPEILALKGERYFEGYWQSEKYFDDAADKLRSDLVLEKELGAPAAGWLNKIVSCNSISIHIRRQDYVVGKWSKVYNILDMDYYDSAIKLIQKKIDEPEFFIFSDDIKWAKDNFLNIIGPKINIVSGSDSIKDYEEMILMSRCGHHIIANSSFSWWGAWLGGGKNKVIIAPAKWFNEFKADTRDLLPSAWIKI